MNLIFRKLDGTNPRDIDQFCELMDDLSERAEDRALLIRRIEEANSNTNTVLMVAEDVERSRICGSLLAVVFGDFCGACRQVMVLENVVTHHEYQHQGVGKRMFEEIEAWGRQKDAAYAILCSGLGRLTAHKFYHALGYEEVKGFKKYLQEAPDPV